MGRLSSFFKNADLRVSLQLLKVAGKLSVANEREYREALKIFKELDQVLLHEDDYNPKSINKLKFWLITGPFIKKMIAYNPNFEKVIEKEFPNLDIATSLEIFPIMEQIGTNEQTQQAFKRILPIADRYLQRSEEFNPKHIAGLKEFMTTSKVVREYVESNPEECAEMPNILECVRNGKSLHKAKAKEEQGLTM